jgi:serine/threonine protein phosphatase PrpC
VKESELTHTIVAELSHPGEKRSENEDRYSVTNYRTEVENKPAVLAVVADGIGGHRAGEVAAQITVDTIVSNLTSKKISDPIAQLKEAVVDAGRAVMQASEEESEREGMGSTVAAAWIIGSRLYTTSAGDSRIYLLQGDNFRQISIDHTWVQEAIEYEIITPDEAKDHPQAHVLRRHVGSRKLPEPDMRLRLKDDESDAQSEANQGLRLHQDDQILLCSDGLTDLVEDSEIHEALQNQTPREAVISLVDLARERGGHDNITVVLLVVPKLPRPRVVSRRTTWLVATLGGALMLISITLIALAASWLLGVFPWISRTPSPSSTSIEPVAPIIEFTSTSLPFGVVTPSVLPTQGETPTLTITPIPRDTATAFPIPTVAPSNTTSP